MIRVVCPQCESKFNAKDELAGKTRKCPKCGGSLKIPQPGQDDPTPKEKSPSQEPAVDTAVKHDSFNPAAERLPTAPALTRLNRQNRYLIVDKTSVAATWKNDGRGWMIRLASGFSQAKPNRDALPAYGSFVLIELVMDHTDEGIRLTELKTYQLASRYAMTKLDKGDNEICEAISGLGHLLWEQKNAIRAIFPELFMRDVWGGAQEVLEFLANADYHSPGSAASATETDSEEK